MKKRIISALSALVMMLSLMAVLPASALDNLSGLKINGSGKYIYTGINMTALLIIR